MRRHLFSDTTFVMLGTLLLMTSAQAASLTVPPDDTSNLITVEPDNFAPGTDISQAVPGVTLSAFGGAPDFGHPLDSTRIFSRFPHQPSGPPPTGELVFGVDSDFFNTGFYFGNHQFRARFSTPTNYVSIQVAPDGLLEVDPTDYALIQIYGTDGTLLDSFTTQGDATSVIFQREARDIAYLVATNPPEFPGDSFALDQLVFRSSAVPEPSGVVLLPGGILALAMLRRFYIQHR